MKKNLILGLAANYDWPILKNFVCSLRQTEYKDDVVLFVDARLDPDTRAALDRYHIGTIGIDGSISDNLPPSVYRIMLFHDFLAEHKDEYNQVLLTDVRDVVFQKDPFAFETHNKLCFFMESASIPLKESNWNALWMIATFGVKALHEMGDNLISNVGTVVGPAERMIPYLASLIRHLENVKVHMMFGIEQAVHNYVIMSKEVDDYLIFHTEDGPVATLSEYKEIRQDENGFFLNLKNDVAHVVHQYDRHPSLKSCFDLKFQ